MQNDKAVIPSAREPYWDREDVRPFQWLPGRQLLRAIRDYQNARGPFRRLARAIAVLRHRFWSVVAAADIPINSQLGGGLVLRHPTGVVVHPDAIVGVNCMLFQGVTLGYGGTRPGAPRLGGHVDVGAGAVVLGGVTIGDDAKIGANAVVLCDVPAGATAVGVPARILPGREPLPSEEERLAAAVRRGSIPRLPS